MTSEEIARRLHQEPDFVNLKRLGYSLTKLLERYPDGVPDKIIATALNLTEEDVEMIYQDIIERVRRSLKIDAL